MLQAATGAAAALTPAEQTWQTIAADLESGAAEAECPQVRLGLGFGLGLGLGLANPSPNQVRHGAPFATTADDAAANMQVVDAIYDAAGLGARGGSRAAKGPD